MDEDAKNDLFGYLQSQPREYIINETALKMIGWENSEEVIGKMFSWSIGDINLQRGEIVGIIKFRAFLLPFSISDIFIEFCS